MQKALIPIAALGVFGFASGAMAEGASGIVDEIDAEGRTLTLESGESFVIEETVPSTDLMEITPGQTVIVTFDEEDGQNVASNVELQGGSADE